MPLIFVISLIAGLDIRFYIGTTMDTRAISRVGIGFYMTYSQYCGHDLDADGA